ncbi:nucleoside diphosphate kinase 6 isoform X3 [Lampetra fluviatilis]
MARSNGQSRLERTCTAETRMASVHDACPDKGFTTSSLPPSTQAINSPYYSGPIRVYVLAHHDAVRAWRELMGPTKVFRAVHTAPESIRACYGLTDTRNTTHGSDSSASALQEIYFFFPEFDVACWFNTWEPAFRAGCVSYHPKLCVHLPLHA